MRRGVAAVLVVAMSGCVVSYNSSKGTATVGGVFTALGGIGALASDGGSGRNQILSDRAGVVIGIMVPGILIGLVGLLGMALHDAPPEPEAEAEAEATAPPGKREQAFALTKTAAQAARSGDCGLSLDVEHEVRDLDAIVYNEWFLRDPAIKACLDAMRLPPGGEPPGDPVESVPVEEQPPAP